MRQGNLVLTVRRLEVNQRGWTLHFLEDFGQFTFAGLQSERVPNARPIVDDQIGHVVAAEGFGADQQEHAVASTINEASEAFFQAVCHGPHYCRMALRLYLCKSHTLHAQTMQGLSDGFM